MLQCTWKDCELIEPSKCCLFQFYAWDVLCIRLLHQLKFNVSISWSADLCMLIYIVHLRVISFAASVKCRQRFTMYFLPINIHSEMLLSQIHLWFQVIFPSSDNNINSWIIFVAKYSMHYVWFDSLCLSCGDSCLLEGLIFLEKQVKKKKLRRKEGFMLFQSFMPFCVHSFLGGWKRM